MFVWVSMFDWDWQILICGVIVLAAGVVLIHRFIRLIAGRSAGCGQVDCRGCPSSDPKAAPSGFVELQTLETNMGTNHRSGS